MLFHNIAISTLAKEDEENLEKIKEKLIKLIDLDLEKEKLDLIIKKNKGFDEKIIYLYEISLDKNKHIKHFIKNLVNKLSKEQKQLLLKQLESRLDERFYFFIRLDKDKLLNDKFEITDSGNCYHIKAKVACFPKKRETAIGILKKILKD